MRDNDSKFQKGFDEVFEAADKHAHRIVPRSPNLKCLRGTGIQTYQHECLDQFVVVSAQQLYLIGREFQAW